MGDGRLALGAGDLKVKVGEARGDRQGHVYHAVRSNSVPEIFEIESRMASFSSTDSL